MKKSKITIFDRVIENIEIVIKQIEKGCAYIDAYNGLDRKYMFKDLSEKRLRIRSIQKYKSLLHITASLMSVKEVYLAGV